MRIFGNIFIKEHTIISLYFFFFGGGGCFLHSIFFFQDWFVFINIKYFLFYFRPVIYIYMCIILLSNRLQLCPYRRKPAKVDSSGLRCPMEKWCIHRTQCFRPYITFCSFRVKQRNEQLYLKYYFKYIYMFFQ